MGSDSEEEWNEDELQEAISDMNENGNLHEDKNSELEEGDDDLDEVEPSEEINDEVAEAIAPSPRTTRSGKSYAQAVERGIEYSRESGLFLARVINESRYSSNGREGSFSQ